MAGLEGYRAIMHRVYRHKPLSAHQKLVNQLAAKNTISSSSVSVSPNGHPNWDAPQAKVGIGIKFCRTLVNLIGYRV
ncbi:hypothetical protein [Nitrosomonas sp.]|uniref:hypothetical protein n=1 Tax=Nitrosomonas sp. TaxID=42353 RepID=UPI00374CA940